MYLPAGPCCLSSEEKKAGACLLVSELEPLTGAGVRALMCGWLCSEKQRCLAQLRALPGSCNGLNLGERGLSARKGRRLRLRTKSPGVLVGASLNLVGDKA